jgi:2-polyprenyl-6-methoxyphenol hydroxylase-like FAD-dependent oxidoreductase
MALRGQRIAVIGGGLGGMAFMNSAFYAGLENVNLYEAAPEFTEVGAGKLSHSASCYTKLCLYHYLSTSTLFDKP